MSSTWEIRFRSWTIQGQKQVFNKYCSLCHVNKKQWDFPFFILWLYLLKQKKNSSYCRAVCSPWLSLSHKHTSSCMTHCTILWTASILYMLFNSEHDLIRIQIVCVGCWPWKNAWLSGFLEKLTQESMNGYFYENVFLKKVQNNLKNMTSKLTLHKCTISLFR